MSDSTDRLHVDKAGYKLWIKELDGFTVFEQTVDKLRVMHRGKNNLWTMRTILFKLSVCVYVQATA